MIRLALALTLTACTAPTLDPDPGLEPPTVEAGHVRDAAAERDVLMMPACFVEYPDGPVAFADDTCTPDASCVVNAEAGLVGHCGLAPL